MSFAQTTFLTDALKRPVTIFAVFPTDKMVCPDYYLPEKKPMKTLYFLEGLTGASNGALCYTHLQNIAEDHNLCVILISGDNKWYADSPATGDYYGKLITEDLAKKVSEEQKELMPKMFFSCGSEDGLLHLNQSYRDFLIRLGYDVTFIEQPGLGHSFAALDAGMADAAKWLPLDTFQGNIIESTPEQNFGYKEYINWAVYYNLK